MLQLLGALSLRYEDIDTASHFEDFTGTAQLHADFWACAHICGMYFGRWDCIVQCNILAWILLTSVIVSNVVGLWSAHVGSRSRDCGQGSGPVQ